jgi:hypothetical protein
MPDLRKIAMLERVTSSADSREVWDLSVVDAAAPTEGASNLHSSRIGIGSVYWAVRHLAEA